MYGKSTVVLVFGNILQGDAPNVPKTLTSEIKHYDDGVVAIKFPDQILSSVGMTNIIRDMLDSRNVKPCKVFYARYGSIWVVVPCAEMLSTTRLRKCLEGVPDLQALFEDRISPPVETRFLPFKNKRHFFVRITAKALEEVPEIKVLWRKSALYVEPDAAAYCLLLTDANPVYEVKGRIDWKKHIGVAISRFGEGKYLIHLEGEPIDKILMSAGVRIDGMPLLRYNLCTRNMRGTVSVSEQEDSPAKSVKTTSPHWPSDNAASIAKDAYEKDLVRLNEIIKARDASIHTLSERLKSSTKSIVELIARVNSLEAENESLKMQLKLARSVATAIDKQKDLPKNEFEPKYIVVKGVKYKV